MNTEGIGYSARVLLLFCGVWISKSVFASCTISGAGTPGVVNFTVPPLIVPRDAEPGTVIYTAEATSASITVSCNSDGDIYQGYNGGLVSGDERTDNPLEGVYETNVPGIGFRAAWANNTAATLNEGALISLWHMGSSKVLQSDGYYPMMFHAIAQFVVTGSVYSGGGVVHTSLLTAEWKYDDRVVGQLSFSDFSVWVQSTTCDVVEKNIIVPLSTIIASEFTSNVSKVVSDDSFKIQLNSCDAGIKVDYQFTTAGSTGVTSSDILSIATGSSAAEGVGIQIMDNNDNVLQFDKSYTAVAQTTKDQSVTIPLKARYIRTGDVKAGQVDAVATFAIYYR
ncbi:fimbrial protein [Kluyvera ascorbata]|uniref:fimbrial protein n=1 Tax=Kluyvera ascorbata TaxID=51288 RepID=UPI0039F5506A